MAKKKTDAAIDEIVATLQKALEPKVSPKAKAPESMGGNPSPKPAVSIPDTDEEEAENEELDEGAITRAAKKGKVTNQFEGNDGDLDGEKPAKKSLAARLRQLATLRKSPFDDADEMPPTAEDGAGDDMGDDTGLDGQADDGSGDAALEQALDTIKSHPRILKALAEALAEMMVAAPQGAAAGATDDMDDDDSDGSDDAYADDGQADDDMQRSVRTLYGEQLAKALAERDTSGDLAKAIDAEEVVGSIAEYLVAYGAEMLARDDENASIIKAQGAQIAKLAKALAHTTEVIDGIGELLVNIHSEQENVNKSLTAINNAPRTPAPGVQVVRTGDDLQKGGVTAVPGFINSEALFKSLEDAASEGDESAIELMALVPHNPRAAYLGLSDAARKQYDSLVAGKK